MHVTLNSQFPGYSKCLINNDYCYHLLREGLAHSPGERAQLERAAPHHCLRRSPGNHACVGYYHNQRTEHLDLGSKIIFGMNE